MKTFTSINVGQISLFDTSMPEDFPVSFQTHSQFEILKKQGKKQKNKLFRQVFHFIQKLIEDQKFYQNIKQFLTRNDPQQKKNETQMIDESEENRVPFQNLSFKKVQITSNNCFESFKNSKASQANLVNERRCSKKISIVIFGTDEEEEMFSGSDSLISEQELKTLRQIKLPSLKMTEQLVKEIYQAPSPFLMNLSLCLFLRYCIRRNSKPDWNDAAWILAIATIEAFKVFYDEELEGMFDCFENVLKIAKQDLIDLERCFLQKIDYNVIIQNYDYQFVLSKFVQMEKINEKENIQV